MTLDDEVLIAYADGELDGAARAAVEAAMRDDVTVAERVAAHRQLRERLQHAFTAEIEEAVPERLLNAARGSPPARSFMERLTARRSRATASGRWTWREFGAMAACVMVGVLLSQLAAGPGAGGRMAIDPDENGLIVVRGYEIEAGGPLQHALSSALAGGSGEGVVIGLSFRDAAGVYCRSFAVQRDAGFSGLACRAGDAWHVELIDRAGWQGESDRYRTAATPSALVAAAVEARSDGEVLDREQEQEARARGWR